MSRRKYTHEEITIAVKESFSIAEVLRKIGLAPAGGSYSTFNSMVKKLGLDTSHFTGQGHLKGKTHNWGKSIPISELLINGVEYTSMGGLKRKIIDNNLLPYKCDDCGITEWNNKPLILHLDHIDGDRANNLLENLRLICPNCHSQTPTYCGRNKALKHAERTGSTKSNIRTYNHPRLQVSKVKKLCIDCSTEIYYQSTRCQPCYGEYKKGKDFHINRKTKIKWPTVSELLELLNTHSYCAVARMLGVSDNAIRKHIKNHK